MIEKTAVSESVLSKVSEELLGPKLNELQKAVLKPNRCLSALVWGEPLTGKSHLLELFRQAETALTNLWASHQISAPTDESNSSMATPRRWHIVPISFEWSDIQNFDALQKVVRYKVIQHLTAEYPPSSTLPIDETELTEEEFRKKVSLLTLDCSAVIVLAFYDLDDGLINLVDSPDPCTSFSKRVLQAIPPLNKVEIRCIVIFTALDIKGDFCSLYAALKFSYDLRPDEILIKPFSKSRIESMSGYRNSEDRKIFEWSGGFYEIAEKIYENLQSNLDYSLNYDNCLQLVGKDKLEAIFERSHRGWPWPIIEKGMLQQMAWDNLLPCELCKYCGLQGRGLIDCDNKKQPKIRSRLLKEFIQRTSSQPENNRCRVPFRLDQKTVFIERDKQQFNSDSKFLKCILSHILKVNPNQIRTSSNTPDGQITLEMPGESAIQLEKNYWQHKDRLRQQLNIKNITTIDKRKSKLYLKVGIALAIAIMVVIAFGLWRTSLDQKCEVASLTPTKSNLQPGEQTTVTVVGNQYCGSDVTYCWRANNGTVPGGCVNQATITYTASFGQAPDTIYVQIQDLEGNLSKEEGAKVQIVGK